MAHYQFAIPINVSYSDDPVLGEDGFSEYLYFYLQADDLAAAQTKLVEAFQSIGAGISCSLGFNGAPPW